MKRIEELLLISFLALFMFVGCSSKNVNETIEGESVKKDFINDLALHDAVRAENKELVSELISKGMAVDTKDKYGYTPLHLAARLNQLEIAQKLFENGAKVNNLDTFGDTPLLDSTRNGTNAMSRFLICNGAKKDVFDKHNMTPLHNASKNGDLFIAMMLGSKDISQMCQTLSITLKSYDESSNKICGSIPTGVATNIKVTLSSDSVDSLNAIGPVKAEIEGKTYCSKLDKNLKKETDYLVTAIGTNSIDKAVATANLKDLKVKKEQPKSEYIKGLYDALMSEFTNDFKTWDAQLDKNGLVFRFKDPSVLFQIGKSDLNSNFKTILDDFFPRYLKVLNEYKNQIEAIRVEGHTSSEYANTKTKEQRYEKNKILSEKRASNVYNYTLNLNNDEIKNSKEWLDKVYSYHGMSFDDLIYDNKGIEDKIQSRRVEFRINKLK